MACQRRPRLSAHANYCGVHLAGLLAAIFRCELKASPDASHDVVSNLAPLHSSGGRTILKTLSAVLATLKACGKSSCVSVLMDASTCDKLQSLSPLPSREQLTTTCCAYKRASSQAYRAKKCPCTYADIHTCTHGRMVTRKSGQMNMWTDGRMDIWTHARTTESTDCKAEGERNVRLLEQKSRLLTKQPHTPEIQHIMRSMRHMTYPRQWVPLYPPSIETCNSATRLASQRGACLGLATDEPHANNLCCSAVAGFTEWHITPRQRYWRRGGWPNTPQSYM